MEKIEESIDGIKDTVKSFEGFLKAFQPPQPTPPMFYWPNNGPLLQPPPNVSSPLGQATVSPLLTPEAPVLQPTSKENLPPVASPSSGQIEQPKKRLTPPVSKNVTHSLPTHHRPPRPIPENKNALPSSMIETWEGKKTVEAVIEENHKLTKVSRVSTLAVKLSRDALFGEEVMKRCTVLGTRNLPGLPRKELYDLKKAILENFRRVRNYLGHLY